MLRQMNVRFLWFEAGKDESERLKIYNHGNPSNRPTRWPVDERPSMTRTGGIDMPYAIPKSAGGMTAHYAGVNYWTIDDTMRSTQMSLDELHVLEFVKNTTLEIGVVCDQYDPRYHTHARINTEPNTQDVFSSTNACFYGRCNGTKCELNKLFVAQISLDTHKDAVDDWFKGSTITEYGASDLIPDTQVTSLVVEETRVTAIMVDSTKFGTSKICVTKNLILAAGVMGDADLLLPHLPSQSYKVFGQPDLVFSDYELFGFTPSTARCDSGSVSGGVMIKLPNPNHGFMSTLGVCKHGNQTRVIWSTPLAVNDKVEGVMRYKNGTSGDIVADMNYDDTILSDLVADFKETVLKLYNVTVDTQNLNFNAGGYHWTGHHELVVNSRVKHLQNVYLADALAVTGPTSGWTSWNARIAGALGALRAVRATSGWCAQTKTCYETTECCSTSGNQTCSDIKSIYKANKCCTSDLEAFCDRYAAVCVANGYSKPYADCLSFVNNLERGAVEQLFNYTVECRKAHLAIAEQSAADAAIHCPHASERGDGYCSTNFCNEYFTTCVTTGLSDDYVNCPNEIATKQVGVATNTVDDYVDDSQLCRQLHLNVAMTGSEPSVHCQRASASGGDSCTTKFCRDYDNICVKPGLAQPYNNCAIDIATKAPGAATPAGTAEYAEDTQLCRHLHLDVATSDTEAAVHCPHASLPGGNACTTSFCRKYENVCVQPGHSVAYEDCSSFISDIPPGVATNTTADYTGNTALCRELHLAVAETTQPNVHCKHASASGGDSCTIEFCRDYEVHCVTPQYSEPFANCLTFMRDSKPGLVGDLFGNSSLCRETHMTLAKQSAAASHCPHASPGGANYCID